MIRVYQYGLPRGCTTEAPRVMEQMRLAHRYRNTLVEIERGRRNAERSLTNSTIKELESNVAQLQIEVDTIDVAIRKARAASRSRSETQAMRDAKREALTKRRAALQLLYVARREDREATQPMRDEFHERGLELQRSARKHSGVSWGTYQATEAAASASFGKIPLYDGIGPNNPKFVRFTGNGHISVHLQNDNILSTERVFSPNAWVYIDPVDPRAFLSETPTGERKRLSRTTLHLRIGSNGREPIMATFSIILHRPLPPGNITWVSVHRRMVGPHDEWTVTFTVALDETKIIARSTSERVIALNIGWRLLDDKSIRIATWADDEGGTGSFHLDVPLILALTYSNTLRSIRDTNFDKARNELIQWLKQTEVPAWLKQKTTHLYAWKSQSALAALCIAWRSQRFDGDDVGYSALETWRHQDKHLWCWESAQRSKSLKRRQTYYRWIARMLANNYGTIVIEDFDLRDVAIRTDTPENETARTHRHLVAISELRLAISHVAHVIKVPAHNITHTCYSCGMLNVFDAALTIEHTCSGCGLVWDQDENAARINLAHYLSERSGGKETTEGARAIGNVKGSVTMKEGKWMRVSRLRREKEARLQSAREPIS